MHWSCQVMKQNEGCPASCTNTCCTRDLCSTFLWKEQSQGWDILTHLIWYTSAQSSICLGLEDTLPASFTEHVTSLRWALQPWEAAFHSKFSFPWPLNSSWLQLPAFSPPGALHFPYNSTAQRDSHLSSARLWCCNHCTGQCPGTPARMCSRQKKGSFFDKNTKYNRACSVQDLQSIWLGKMGLSSCQA